MAITKRRGNVVITFALIAWMALTNAYLLGVSASILQDDSGIPLRYCIPEKWTLRFFGTYTGPIHLFKNFYQPNLRQYYATSSPKPLTFGFGYQYDRQDARLLLAVRR